MFQLTGCLNSSFIHFLYFSRNAVLCENGLPLKPVTAHKALHVHGMYTPYQIRILFLFMLTLQPRYVLIYKHLIPAGHTVSSDIRNSTSYDTTDLHENAMLKQAPAVDHPQGNN